MGVNSSTFFFSNCGFYVLNFLSMQVGESLMPTQIQLQVLWGWPAHWPVKSSEEKEQGHSRLDKGSHKYKKRK